MRTMLPTTNVTVLLPVSTSTDSLGQPTLSYTSQQLSGVLVSPVSSTDDSADHEYQDEASIRVDIPSTFTTSIAEAVIVFRGKAYKVIGDPMPYLRSPLPWDRYALCSKLEAVPSV